MTTHTLTVTGQDQDVRVDIYVARSLPDVIPSRMFVKRLIDDGRLLVNGAVVRACYHVQTDDRIDLDVKDEDYPDERLKPEPAQLDIVWEDADVIALNKPVGISVHPAAGNYSGTLVNALVYHFDELSDINGGKRPGIVHRLDKETSGIILVARNNFAHARLAAQFEEHSIEKKYVALVEGIVQFDEGRITAAIARHPKHHDMRRIAREGEPAKTAETFYSVIRRCQRLTSVALYPSTGRTHQLRLHMRHSGHPIMGDEKYGNKGNFPRMALHAQAIAFDHPRSGHRLELSVPLPDDFMDYV